MELQGLTETQIAIVEAKQKEALEAAASQDGKDGWSQFNKVDGVLYFQKQTPFAPMLVGKGVIDSPPHVVFEVLGAGRIEYRKELEVNLDTSKEIERINPYTIVFLNRYKTVPLVRAREFLIMLHKARRPEAYFLIATSLPSHPKCGPDPSYERATCHVGGWVIQPHSDPARSNVTYLACASLGLPGWLTKGVSQQQPAQLATLRKLMKRDHAEKSNLTLYPPPAPLAVNPGPSTEAKSMGSSGVPRPRAKSKKEGLIKKEGYLQRLGEGKEWETKWVKLQGVTLSCKQNPEEAGLSEIIHLTNVHYLIEGPIEDDNHFVIKLVPEEPGDLASATPPSEPPSSPTAASFTPPTPSTTLPSSPSLASTSVRSSSPTPLPLPSHAFRTEDRVLCDEWLHAIRENIKISSVGKLQRKLKADRKLALAAVSSVSPLVVAPPPSPALPAPALSAAEPLPTLKAAKPALWRRLLCRPSLLLLLLLFVAAALKIRTKERLLEIVDSCKKRLNVK